MAFPGFFLRSLHNFKIWLLVVNLWRIKSDMKNPSLIQNLWFFQKTWGVLVVVPQILFNKNSQKKTTANPEQFHFGHLRVSRNFTLIAMPGRWAVGSRGADHRSLLGKLGWMVSGFCLAWKLWYLGWGYCVYKNIYIYLNICNHMYIYLSNKKTHIYTWIHKYMMLLWVIPVFFFNLCVFINIDVKSENSFSFECLTILCGTCDSG